MRTGNNDKDRLDRKLIQSGSRALFTERRGFQLPGFSFLQNFCRKNFIQRFYFWVANHTVPSSCMVTSADLQPGCGLTIPPLLYLNLLGVGRSQPVIKSLKVGLYARVVILRKNIQARYSMLQKDASNLTLCIGCMCQGVGSGGVLHEWPLWEGIRSYPHIAQSKFQPAPKWIQH